MYAEDIERWISERFKEPARAKAALMQVSGLKPDSLRERVVRCILSLSESDYDSVATWAKKASQNQVYVIGLAEYDNREVRRYNFNHGLYSQQPYSYDEEA